MTKRLLPLVSGAIAVAALSTFSQIRMEAGVVAGLSMFHESMHNGYSPMGPINFDTVDDTKTGFVGGIVFDINFLNIISIEPGLVYSQRGGQTSLQETLVNPSGEITDKTVIFKENFDYLAIPIHAKVKWPGPIVRPYALGGINLAFLLSAKEENGSDPALKISYLNSTAFAIDLGGGIEFDLPVVIPYLEYVYDLGVSNLLTNHTDDQSLKTSGSEIKAGIRFKL